MGHLSTVDYIIMALYLVGLFSLGIYCGRGQKNIDDFFLAGRKMGGLILGVSMWASLTSGNSMLAGPGYSFNNDLQMIHANFIGLISALIIIRFIIPTFQRLCIITSYEYLEKRFHTSVRYLGSALFVLLRGSWLAGVIYGPSLAISAVIDIPWLDKTTILGVNGELFVCILIIGFMATIYTGVGGMKAVIYTDLVQFFVIVGGVFTTLYLIIHNIPGGIKTVWQIGSAHGHTKLFNFKFSPFTEVTFWWILFYYFPLRINQEGVDQISVQRYLSAKSIKDSAVAVVTNALYDFPLMTTFYFLGVALFVFFQINPTPLLPENADQVFPFFIARHFPLGLSGLFLAAVIAATQSSVDSGINSISATIISDWYKPIFKPNKGESHDLRISKILTFALGLLATFAALFYIRLGQIYKAVGTTMGFFMGPLLGIFLLGLLTTRTKTRSLWVGVIAGLIVTLIWKFVVQGTWMLMPIIGLSLTMSIGYSLSFLIKVPQKNLDGLTYWTPKKDVVIF